MPDRECPRCRGPLKSGQFGPLELDICQPCGWVWFDAGELNRIIAAGPQVVRRLEERLQFQAQSVCPICRSALKNIEFPSLPGVVLDTCGFCEGFWLRQDTLGQVAQSLEGVTEWEMLSRQAQKTIQQEASRPPSHQPAPLLPPPPLQTAPPAPKSGGLLGGLFGKKSGPEPAAKPAGQAGNICSNCAEMNSPQAPLCWACGTPLKAQAIGKCPGCEGPMTTHSLGTTSLEACQGCGGVWVTPNRLNGIFRSMPDEQARLKSAVGSFNASLSRRVQTQVTCPLCRIFMYNAPLGMLTDRPVNNCPTCYGMFLSYETFCDILKGPRRKG